MSHALLVPPPQEGPVTPYPQQVEQAREALPSSLPGRPEEVLVALDVDGTLLRADGASPRVRRTVSEAIEAGINVVIATGRGMGGTRPVFDELQIKNGLSVSSNGAQTLRWHNAGNGAHVVERLQERLFQPGRAAETIMQALPGVVFGADDRDGGMLVSHPFAEGELLTQQKEVPLEELFALNTTKLIARAEWMSRNDFEAALAELDLTDFEYAVGWTSWADIMAAGTTKASALQELATALGASPQGTVAMGDGANDVEMLQWAAHGVAMGGAVPVALEAADASTGPVDHDGAAAVLEALLERY